MITKNFLNRRWHGNCSSKAKELQAYFTVEAALLFPLCLFILMITVLLFLFQYDRCLMEQDVGILALYAGTLDIQYSSAEKERLLKLKINEEKESKYVLWEMEPYGAEIRAGYASASGKGVFKMPVWEWNPLGQWEDWETQYFCRITRNSPADYLYYLRKISQADSDE